MIRTREKNQNGRSRTLLLRPEGPPTAGRAEATVAKATEAMAAREAKERIVKKRMWGVEYDEGSKKLRK